MTAAMTNDICRIGAEAKIAVIGDTLFVLAAAVVARWLAQRPAWSTAQRWVLASVFVAIAAKLALDERR